MYNRLQSSGTILLTQWFGLVCRVLFVSASVMLRCMGLPALMVKQPQLHLYWHWDVCRLRGRVPCGLRVPVPVSPLSES